MRTFQMYRAHDESGISGTGVVVEGVIFSDGKVIIRWVVHTNSISIYETFVDFEKIHIGSHPTNKTILIWENGERTEYGPGKIHKECGIRKRAG